MADYKCFLCEPTDEFVYELRRFHSPRVGDGIKCERPHGYHDATVEVGGGPRVHTPEGCWGWGGSGGCAWAGLSDSRWPTKCECGYVFTEQDMYQPNEGVLFKGSPDGVPRLLRDLPVGALYYADWMECWLGPDNRHLVVRTPSGDWSPDGPSKDGSRPWTRTGAPPYVTARPSIDFGPGRFHGFLTDGILRDC